MNTSIQHLPSHKQRELTILTNLLKEFKEVEMVILFGSYARNTWVEDRYVEKGILYEYKSDFDILVVTSKDDIYRSFKIEGKVDKELKDKVGTPLGLIFHSANEVNRSLTWGSYFFCDIKKEGILLYDSEKYSLKDPKELTPQESQQKAQEYYDKWFDSANEFLIDYLNAFKRGSLLKAAFELHQATERLYTTIQLVYTNYRPKEHDLKKLDARVRNSDKRFDVFPRTTKEEKQLFELLRRAYVDARYKMDEYAITEPELEYLSERVLELKVLTEKLCKERILMIGEE